MNRLLKATFECEVITPMFVGGANPRDCELRAASIRGALRFWWRSFQYDFSTYHELLKKEENIWGGTSTEKAGQSKIWLKINSLGNLDLGENVSSEYNIDTFKSNQGIAYLFYSMFTSKEKSRFLKVGSSFQICLTALKGDKFLNSNQFNDVLKSFYLLTHIGGLGSRSRRGAGAFRINSVEFENVEKPVIDPESYRVFDKREYQSLFPKFQPKLLDHSSICDLKISEKDNFLDWISALNDIGNRFKKFRTQNKSKFFETPAFGFPVMHGIRNRNISFAIAAEKTKTGTKLSDVKSLDRRSSPLTISLLNDKNGLRWCVTLFGGKLVPDGYFISKVSGKGANRLIEKQEQPSNDLLIEFFNSL